MTATPQSPDAPEPARRGCYLVLGMHRSGTSALTQVLALAGADLPQNLMPGDEHNAKGYFEPWTIAVFNDQRLRAGGGAWDDVFTFPYTPLPPAEEAEWRERALELFDGEYGDAPRPLLKDPRVTPLLPLWLEALAAREVAPLCVIAVRHPLEVAGSLGKRNGFHTDRSLLLWTAYMLAAERYTRGLPRVFVGYEALLTDWRGELTRIQQALGERLPRLDEAAEREIDDFLTEGLRHHASARPLAELSEIGALTAPVYDWMCAAGRDEAPDLGPLERAADAVAELKARFGPLVSPVVRDLDATRAELQQARADRDHAVNQLEERLRELLLLQEKATALADELLTIY